MNKRSLILAILLIFVIILSSNTVLAEKITDNTQLQQSDDVAIIEEINDDKLSSEQTVTAGSNSSAIQEKINSLSDGDTLNFEAGEYRDICIYIDKNITVNGNGAKLIGYDTPSKENTPELIWKETNESGYAIENLATVYILKTTGVTLNGLTIIGGANSAAAYSNALIYAYEAKNLTVKNNTLDGSSWGLYFQKCPDGIVRENTIKNQKVTGFLNFGSARTVIEQNRIINAENHGIDVRHGTGPDVQVINNTVIGSKEGIYLMHSKGHTAVNNTLINCTISSITCYGSSNINLYGNKMQKSRIGILLGGGYNNITVGENAFDLDSLPYPPTFVYYVGEAKSDFQSAGDIMGTHSDSSTYSPNYIAYTGINAPKDIAINYDSILKKTGTEWSVPEGCSNENIQTMINGMNDGDSLSFTKNAVYNDISIYTDKNIKIFGNNATLIGFNTIDLNNVPEKVRKNTTQGGYAIAYRAVLYIINSTGTVVSDLNIVAKYPGYDTTKATTTTDEYKTAGIYGDKNENLVITGCDVSGASWGIFQQYSSNSIISKNNIRDSYTTGIMNFGSPNAIIVENNIFNAINHGIDTRHGQGPNVTIAFNTISGAKEGIYLMHSRGHTVYNNTVKDCKISGITAYGSGNEVIFNNTILGSRIAILLGGGYYNVTIGNNSYSLDSLPFPPTFATFLAKAENKYQSKDDVVRTYSDKETVTINDDRTATSLSASDKNVYLQAIIKGDSYQIILKDANGKALAGKEITVKFNGVTYKANTNANGVATVTLKSSKIGSLKTEISFAGDDVYKPSSKTTTVKITKEASKLTAKKKTFKAKTKTKKYTVTLKSKSGKAISKAKVTIKVKNKKFTAKTNAKGKATFKITKLTKKGTYKSTVTFAGNKYFNKVSKKVKITVKK
ncbi:right-handed parallel beta-helix repeat-containing protein [Methanobrevibacter sp.]